MAPFALIVAAPTRRRLSAAALRVGVSGLALAFTATACGRDAPRAPATATVGARSDATASQDTIPELAPSIVELPVLYDLDPAVSALERAVPRTVGNLDERRQIPGHPKLTYAFVADRSPFDVAVRGTTVTVSAVVTYRARGWYKPPIGPSLGGSCGISGEAPRLRITLRSSINLQPDWSVRARTQVPEVVAATDEQRDKCRLTMLKLDVTERVVEAVRKQLEGKAALLDDRVRQMNVRQRVDRWWALLGRPIRVGNDAWLELRPEGVQLGVVRGADRTLVAPLALSARPRIVTGPRPDSSTTALPDLIKGTPDAGGLHLLLDASLGYDAASRGLSKALVGKRFEGAGNAVSVRDVRVFSGDQGRVALAVGLTGDVDARIVLVGRPAYDSVSRTLTVPDLDFAVADASVIVRGADQLGHNVLRDALRERARWQITPIIDSARVRAERAINRELTRGVQLSGTVDGGHVVSVYAATDAVHVRATAGGTLSLAVSRPVRVRRPAPKVVAAKADAAKSGAPKAADPKVTGPKAGAPKTLAPKAPAPKDGTAKPATAKR
jgi:hypothetical protein